MSPSEAVRIETEEKSQPGSNKKGICKAGKNCSTTLVALLSNHDFSPEPGRRRQHLVAQGFICEWIGLGMFGYLKDSGVANSTSVPAVLALAAAGAAIGLFLPDVLPEC